MDDYLLIALLLAGIGGVLLLAEFVLPSGGVFVVLGVTALAVAVGVVWRYGSTAEAAGATVALGITIPVAGVALFALWKRMAVPPGGDAGAVTLADAAEESGLGRLVGRYGKTLTAMRPSGAVEIEGRRTDALSEGPLIAAGAWVKCVSVRAGHVVVREVDAPGDLAAVSLEDEPVL